MRDGRRWNYGGSLSFYEGSGTSPSTRGLSSKGPRVMTRGIGGATHQGTARLRTVLQASNASPVATGGSGLPRKFAIPLNGLSASASERFSRIRGSRDRNGRLTETPQNQGSVRFSRRAGKRPIENW